MARRTLFPVSDKKIVFSAAEKAMPWGLLNRAAARAPFTRLPPALAPPPA
jgi:hypothetical protein